jgi:hypothetical protein
VEPEPVADRVREAGAEAIETAIGRAHRSDPVLPRSGGPAGNASLTAWTGLLLLVLLLAELVTLLDVRGLISWHVAIGALLVPPAVLKTVTTGWRIARYYAGSEAYRTAGPPPMLLRVLGPLVVLSTLAVLASGVTLVLVGEDVSRESIVTVLGLRIDAITIHQASFVAWAVTTGLHVLGRLVPAVQTTLMRQDREVDRPGGPARAALMFGVLAVSALTAYLLLGAMGDWGSDEGHRGARPPASSSVRQG